MKARHKQRAKKVSSHQSPKNPGKSSSVVPNNPWLIAGVCIFLATIVWVVYGQTSRFPFVDFDDDQYIYQNPLVIHGLTLSGIESAFSTRAVDNWIPLTVLSHMVDCQVYALNAGGHHLTNVLLHAASAILLFLVLHQMTQALWRSAFVAALFAIHPVGVESVAWVSERKDVLSGLFFMLTLWAYVGYSRNQKSWIRYAGALLLFAMGLMAKPMLVTLPFILLLLDYWPLKRVNAATVRQLIIEKIPFLLLSLAVCVITFLLQQKAGAVMTTAVVPMPLRIENACISGARYLGKLFWPGNLAVFHPLPAHWPVPAVMFSVALLAVICVAVVVWRKQWPFAFTGWLWFVGMLLPVIGLVQAGRQAMADRYLYLPQIGLYIILAWLVAELTIRLRGRLLVAGTLAAVILASLIYCAREQAAYWKDSETVLAHTLAITTDNWWVHVNLGYALMQKGQLDDAISQFREGIKENDDDAQAHSDLGSALLREGQVDDAIAEYHEALKNHPNFAAAHSNLGYALVQKGQFDEAIAECHEALKLNPADAGTYNNLGDAYYEKGQEDEAIAQYREGLKYDPDNADFLSNIGSALLREGQVDQAIAQYMDALKKHPDNVDVQNLLASALIKLAMSGTANPAKIMTLARQENDLSHGNNPLVLRVLAGAESGCGLYSEALVTAERALTLATGHEDSAFIGQLQHEIASYQAGTLTHSTETTNVTGGTGNGP
jgi:tetratricopeptide (TPR) repeat protein